MTNPNETLKYRIVVRILQATFILLGGVANTIIGILIAALLSAPESFILPSLAFAAFIGVITAAGIWEILGLNELNRTQ